MRNFSQSISNDQIVDVTTVRASGWDLHDHTDLGYFVSDVSERLERAFSANNILDVSQKWLAEEVRGLLLSVISERSVGLSSQQCAEKVRDLPGHTPSEERVMLALANFIADLLSQGMFAKQQCFVYHNLNEGHCLLVRHVID